MVFDLFVTEIVSVDSSQKLFHAIKCRGFYSRNPVNQIVLPLVRALWISRAKGESVITNHCRAHSPNDNEITRTIQQLLAQKLEKTQHMGVHYNCTDNYHQTIRRNNEKKKFANGQTRQKLSCDAPFSKATRHQCITDTPSESQTQQGFSLNEINTTPQTRHISPAIAS
jgi:hypothetical protein